MATMREVPGNGYGNPFIDGLIRGGMVWDPASGPVKIHFAGAETEAPLHDTAGDYAGIAQDWTGTELTALRDALAYVSSVCGITFAESSVQDADVIWWKASELTLDGTTVSSYHEPLRAQLPDKSTQAWGLINSDTLGWDQLGHGGLGRFMIMNMIGQALGLHHVRDDNEFPQDFSLFTWNQGIYTVMSSGVLGGPRETGLEGGFHDEKYGAQGGLGAFDIAALQALYGANQGARLGNDVYTLPQTQAPGTGWYSIWDSGGIDTIDGTGSPLSVQIDLSSATLTPAIPEQGGKNAGGLYSARIDISGGFTIAAGTVIENAKGGNSGDVLKGNAAANSLWGNAGRDFLYGYEGNDILYGGDGYDTIDGGSGDDLIYAGADEDIVKAGAGNDTVYGESGDNDIYGADGNDSLFGGETEDHLFGDAGDDFLMAGGGRDQIEGGSGNDRMYGGGENDKIYAAEGNDFLSGDGDADFLYGGSGNDKLYGGSGADNISGEDGNDYLAGGAHRDVYFGGSGRDVFALDTRPNRKAAPDYFDDFNARHDQIVILKKAFKLKKGSYSKKKLKKDAFTTGSKAKDKEDRFIADKHKDVLYYDPDGIGAKAQIAVAQFKNLKSISYRDFDIA